jgi:hypothetical protein
MVTLSYFGLLTLLSNDHTTMIRPYGNGLIGGKECQTSPYVR